MPPKEVWVVFMLIALTRSENCMNSSCTCTSNHVNCHSLVLKKMINFSLVPSHAISMDLGDNQIKRIPSLVGVDGLKTLILSYNEISEISSEAFQNYSQLENLDLARNQIYDMSGLEALVGLRYLNLSHNVIRSIGQEFFSNMKELVELRLNGNPLHYVRYEMFRSLSKVEILELSGCALSSLPNDVFHDMTSLTELDLSRNGFERVPSSGLKSASKLRKLNLNTNKLTSIEENAFKKCRHLETLELSDMGTLESIKTGAFSGLKLLKILKISHNPQLKDLNFGAFEGLFNRMDDSTGLQELILRENGLTEIHSPSLTLCKVGTLDLQGNPWKCDCKLLWITTCELREELTSDLMCSSPQRLENKPIIQLGAEDMICLPEVFEKHQQKSLKIVVVTTGLIGALFCIMVILVVLRKRKIMEWWYYRKRGSGAVYYVKARTNSNGIRGDI